MRYSWSWPLVIAIASWGRVIAAIAGPVAVLTETVFGPGTPILY